MEGGINENQTLETLSSAQFDSCAASNALEEVKQEINAGKRAEALEDGDW